MTICPPCYKSLRSALTQLLPAEDWGAVSPAGIIPGEFMLWFIG